MRLKRLTLQGYKTFANKTEFLFDEGITAIIGPNGSGKSNIADGLRWVLGEQSYSELRGRRTVDMIFAGSRTRSRSGMAQVSLVFDNSENWLPIDFTEVEISRVAHRSGDNEYLLNGQKVRLKDIAELLASSGLSQRTYTIVGQGLVDRALALSPLERRALFEEAAGVTGYKAKREESLRRLRETDLNLLRAGDIVDELSPRLSSLKRQAQRASSYEQMVTDLRNKLKLWYGYRLHSTHGQLEAASKRAATSRERWEHEKSLQIKLQKELDSSRSIVAKLTSEMGQHRVRLESARSDVESARRQLAILRERQSRLEDQLQSATSELPDLESQHAKASEMLNQAMEDLSQSETEIRNCRATLSAFDDSSRTVQQAIAELTGQIDRLEGSRRDAEGSLASNQGRLTELESRQAAMQLQIDNTQRIEELKTELTGSMEDLSAAKAALTRKREELDASHIHGRNLETRNSDLRARLKGLAADASRARSERDRLQARHDLLTEQGQTTDLKSTVPILGRISAHVSVPAKYRLAIEAAASALLEAHLVSTDAELRKMVSERDEESSFAAASLQIKNRSANVDPSEFKGAIGFADRLVDSPKKYRPLISAVLGHVLVVQDDESAIALAGSISPGILAVSLSGVVAHSSGVVTVSAGGELAVQQARSDKIAELSQQIETLAETLKNGGGKIASAEAELQEIDRQLGRSQEARRDLRSGERQLSEKMVALGSTSARLSQLLKSENERSARRQKSAADLQHTIHELLETIVTGQSELQSITSMLDDSRSRLEALPARALEAERSELTRILQSAKTVSSGRQAVVDSRSATLQQVSGLLSRRKSLVSDLGGRLEQLELKSVEAALRQHEEGEKQQAEAISRFAEEQIDREQSLRELEENMAASQISGYELEKNLTDHSIALSRIETQFANLVERVRIDLGITIPIPAEGSTAQGTLPLKGIGEYLPVVTELPEDLEERIHLYRGRLERLGPVNPDAPKEYDEARERHEFMTQQILDLTQTKGQLERLIEELDTKTSEAFAESVREVDSIFSDSFTRLFGGGSARLVLTDPDDLTISGVEIEARLPRRREQPLSMLSGGERSLTAAALIFSLLKYAPTPFCVLDEMDAMLDEANVGRFREMLKELSQSTQFVLITHNRGTVQVARSLYGVSMGSDSVSRVLSIKPDSFIAADSEEQPALIA